MLRMYCKSCISFNFSIFLILTLLTARKITRNYRKKNLYLKFDTLKLRFCTVYMFLCQLRIFFTYPTDFMSCPRLSFVDYLKGDTHLVGTARAPARDATSMQASIRRDLDQPGDSRTMWLHNLPRPFNIWATRRIY